MTLAFSTQLNKKPTYFVDKILVGLKENKIIDYNEFSYLQSEHINKPFVTVCFSYPNPKIHTIRADEKDRWKAGMDIHFVINNRTKNRYQFAPIVKCISTQEINIVYWYNPKTEMFDKPNIYIDGKVLSKKQIELLAINDGFENSTAFFAYFNTSFNGKLIHWTNTKY